MLRPALVAVLFAVLATTPALADPNCLNRGGGITLNLTLGARIGGGADGGFSEQDQREFDVLALRGRGINADTAERTWLGCLKVTRRVNGGWVTEYYDPDTMELVY